MIDLHIFTKSIFNGVSTRLQSPGSMEYLHKKDINGLYDYLIRDGIGDSGVAVLTAILLNININPLDYFTIIPNYYARRLPLTDVVIPSRAEYIGYESFMGCSKLKTLVVEEGVRTIGFRTFSGCSKLERVKLPSTLNIINREAFSYCSSLTTIEFEGSMFQWKNELKLIAEWNSHSNIKKIICNDGVIEL